jgi:hypothetical protein
MSVEKKHKIRPRWEYSVEKYEGVVVAAYLFASRLWTTVATVENIGELQQAALRAFSGILLVLIGLIAMGRHVLEIDLHYINFMTLFGFSSLILSLAASYILVKRAQINGIGKEVHCREGNDESIPKK